MDSKDAGTPTNHINLNFQTLFLLIYIYIYIYICITERDMKEPQSKEDWFGLAWFYDISTVVGYQMLNPVFTHILNKPLLNTFCGYRQLNYQTLLFLTIWFSVNHLFTLSLNINTSIWPIDRTLLGTTNPAWNGLGSDGDEEVLRIPQRSSITGASPSYGLMSYPRH